MTIHVHGHAHQHGKSEMFTKDSLARSHIGKANYDNEMSARALEHIAAAVRAGNVTLITRRISPVGEASDDSGMPSVNVFLEWKFLHGVPVEAITL